MRTKMYKRSLIALLLRFKEYEIPVVAGTEFPEGA